MKFCDQKQQHENIIGDLLAILLMI